MVSDKHFNQTNDNKVAVFVFGRFNPPTKGHERLINYAEKVASRLNADLFVFPSQTTNKQVKRVSNNDPKKRKNPLKWDTKVRLMRKLFPNINILQEPSIHSAHDVIPFLEHQKYQIVYFVVGGDRVEEFNNRWVPYAQKHFKCAKVLPAGMRDPDKTGVVGMSATKAREAATNNDLQQFKESTGWDGDILRELFVAVKQGMDILNGSGTT